MKPRNWLLFIILWGAVLAGSCQEPAETAHRLYLSYDSARTRGDFALSEYYLKSIIKGDYRLPDLNMAVVHNSLGSVLYETGRFDEALDHYRVALGFSSGSDRGSIRVRINIFNNIALLLNWQGDYSNALEHFNKATRLLDSLPELDENYFSRLSMLRFNSGVVYYRMGRFEEALALLKESERIKEAHQHEYLGSVYFNLAQVLREMKKPEQADIYYRKAIERWISEQDTGFFQLANIYLQFGQFLAGQGDTVQGYEYFQRALQNYRANFGIRHPLTADCYEKMAGYYLDRLDFRRALDFTQLALVSVSRDFNETDIYSNPAIQNSLHDLTLLKIYAAKVKALEGFARHEQEESGKLDILRVALETNDCSIEVLHRLQEFYLSKESRLYLLSNQKEVFTTGIRLNLKLFQLTDDESFKERAFMMAARSKSNELLFEMRAKEWLYLESLHDTLASSALQLKARMDRYSNQIQLESQELNPDSARLADWQEQLFQVRDRYNRQMERLSQAYPRMGQLEYLKKEFSLPQIRRNLKRSETLVEYYISGSDSKGSKELFTFIVTRNRCHVLKGQLDSSFFSNLDILMQNLHEFDPYRENSRSYGMMKKALFGIYQQLVEPVESLFKGSRVIVVPDEKLAFLPFDALIDRLDPDTIMNYAGLSYLIHRYDITYAYNSQLIQKRQKSKLRFPEVTAWIPEYVSSNEGSPWYLDGAVAEVDAILKLVKGKRIPASQEKGDTRKFIQDDKILHLAMHALAGDQNGGSSFFILNSEKDSMLSGRLYDYEISAMNLRSPMVVLSSCRTGTGELQFSEGIMSLSRSFLLAGASSVVHTLWPVEDHTGPDIMLDFYRGLKQGKTKGRALTAGKKRYLVNNPPSYTHPYYWASFQVIGNPVSLICGWKFIGMTGLAIFIALSCAYLILRSLRQRA